jgi:O-antigen ligase
MLGFFLLPLLFSSKFNDHYTVIKWLGLQFVAVLICLSFVSRSAELKLPRLSFRALALVGCLVLSYSGVTIIFAPRNILLELSDWLSFLVIVIAAYSCETTSCAGIVKATVLGTIIVTVYCGLHAFGIDPIGYAPPAVTSSFGYPNMAAEYLALSILVHFWGLTFLSSRLWRWTTAISTIAACVLLLVLGSRAALIGLGVSQIGWAAYDLLVLHRGKREALFRCHFAIILITVSVLVGKTDLISKYHFESSPLPVLDAQVHLEKPRNIEIRLARWANSLRMIEEHPWGVGPENFEFSYLSYYKSKKLDSEITETLLAKTPHNALIQAFCEGGIPLGIFLLFSVSYFLVFLIKARPACSSQMPFPLALFAFFFVDAMVAFPLGNAVPFFFFAFGLGFICQVAKVPPVKFGSAGRVIALSMAGVLFVVGVDRAYSAFVEANYNSNYSHLDRACFIYPPNWRTCAQKGWLELQSGAPARAIRTFETIAKGAPNQFVAMRGLLEAQIAASNFEDGCHTAQRYFCLFPHSPHVQSFYKQRCLTQGSRPDE